MMAKLKIRKSVQKRLKVTKTGKLIHPRSGKVITGKRAKKLKKMLGQ